MAVVFALAAVLGCSGASTATGSSNVVVASVRVSPDSVDVPAGQAVSLTATAWDSSGGVVSGAAITWLSLSPARATVSEGTVQTAVGGRVLVVARSGDAADTAVVRVLPGPIDFETFADGSPMCANSCTVSGEFAARGVTFSYDRPYPPGLSPTIERIGSADGLTTHVVTVATQNGVWLSGRVTMTFGALRDTVVFTLRGGQSDQGSFLVVPVPAGSVATLSSGTANFGITGILREDVVRVVRVGGIQRIEVGDSSGAAGSAPMIDDLTIGP